MKFATPIAIVIASIILAGSHYMGMKTIARNTDRYLLLHKPGEVIIDLDTKEIMILKQGREFKKAMDYDWEMGIKKLMWYRPEIEN